METIKIELNLVNAMLMCEQLDKLPNNHYLSMLANEIRNAMLDQCSIDELKDASEIPF